MFSTTLGLAAVALRGDPDMRTLSAPAAAGGAHRRVVDLDIRHVQGALNPVVLSC